MWPAHSPYHCMFSVCSHSFSVSVSLSLSSSSSSPSLSWKRMFFFGNKFQLLIELVLPRGKESCSANMELEAPSCRWGVGNRSQKVERGVPWWLRGFRIPHCHCCRVGSVSGLATSPCHGRGQRKRKASYLWVHLCGEWSRSKYGSCQGRAWEEGGMGSYCLMGRVPILQDEKDSKDWSHCVNAPNTTELTLKND